MFPHIFSERAAYHGEIGFDPSSGAILHVTLEAEIRPNGPVARAGVLVEYGPVEIGGKSYVCPARSVALLVSHALQPPTKPNLEPSYAGPATTFLNDVAFGQYHRFGAKTRIVTQDSACAGADGVKWNSSAERSKQVSSFELRSTGKVAIASAFAAGLFISCASPCVHGQSDDKTAAEDQAPAVLKLESNLVVVRVIVRDAQGNPVKGLKREDFKLYDQSKEQSIAQFEEEPSDEVRLAAPSVQTPSIPATGTPGKTAMPRFAGPERFVALYFDDLDTSQGDMMRARDAADRFLAAGLQPNDRVAIFTTGGLLSDFTSDLKQIHDALFMLRPSVRAQASERLAECPELSDYQAVQIAQYNNPDSDAWRVALADLARCRGADANPLSSGLSRTTAAGMNVDMVQILTQARRIVDQAELQVRSNLQQFERVVKYVSQKPGEHTVILVSPGFVSESERPQLDRIIDIALRSQVVINSLDPRGLAVLMEEAERGLPRTT